MHEYLYDCLSGRYDEPDTQDCLDMMLEMAERKDKEILEIKEFLKRKKAEYHMKYENTLLEEQLFWGVKEDAIDLVLLELWGEEV